MKFCKTKKKYIFEKNYLVPSIVTMLVGSIVYFSGSDISISVELQEVVFIGYAITIMLYVVINVAVPWMACISTNIMCGFPVIIVYTTTVLCGIIGFLVCVCVCMCFFFC